MALIFSARWPAMQECPRAFPSCLATVSDELISLLAIACDLPGASFLAPVPGFVMYALSAQLQGLRFVGVPLDADFELDEGAMLGAIERDKPSVVFLAYPNNPTANLWNDDVVRRIIDAQGRQGGLVVIDEAYQPFAGRSWVDRIAGDGHVLLMRTLSKFGIAGARLGYLMGPTALISEIDKVRPPYNISVLNCECAIFALEHAEVFAQQAAEIRLQRTRILDNLARWPAVECWPSDANMILVRVSDADTVFNALKKRGVLVKNVSRMHALLANCLRLTVGTSDENTQMLAALEASL